MCEAEVPRAFVRRGSRSQEAALCCGADPRAALSARPGGFGRRGWILWPSGNAHSPSPLGLPGSAQSPSPRGLSESAQSPFPARPGPRPSDALALAGQLLFTSSFFTILAMTCRLRPPLLLPSETFILNLGISVPFSLETNISHFAFCRHLEG